MVTVSYNTLGVTVAYRTLSLSGRPLVRPLQLRRTRARRRRPLSHRPSREEGRYGRSDYRFFPSFLEMFTRNVSSITLKCIPWIFLNNSLMFEIIFPSSPVRSLLARLLATPLFHVGRHTRANSNCIDWFPPSYWLQF